MGSRVKAFYHFFNSIRIKGCTKARYGDDKSSSTTAWRKEAATAMTATMTNVVPSIFFREQLDEM